MYLLIDPPVNPFSPSDEIVAWIAKLEELAPRPEYREKAPRADRGSLGSSPQMASHQ